VGWDKISAWWRERSESWGRDPDDYIPLFRDNPRSSVDANTRDFWRGGDEVELPGKASRPVAQLLAGHPQQTARPRANPAFIEATFVELMRAGQYERAYAGLAPECRKAWGSVEAFADAHAHGGALRGLRGVNVTESRILEHWIDPSRGTSHANVAELKVEYLFGHAESAAVVPQTVHLIPVAGKWCSLSYPPTRRTA